MVAGDFAQNAGLKVGPRGHRVQCALRGRAGVMSGGKQWSNDESFVAAKKVQHGQKFAVDGSLTRFSVRPELQLRFAAAKENRGFWGFGQQIQCKRRKRRLKTLQCCLKMHRSGVNGAIRVVGPNFIVRISANYCD